MKRNKVGEAPNYSKKEIKISKSDNWRTPKKLWAKIYKQFPSLKWDRAADNNNHILPYYNTLESFEGLGSIHPNCMWSSAGFCNPPYSHPGDFFHKAHESAVDYGTLTVMLVKVATSENYWTETVKDAHVRFLAHRQVFEDEEGIPHYTATFGSAIIIFARITIGKPETETWDYNLEVPIKLF